MACRCQERREVIKRAFVAKSTTQAAQAIKFVTKTIAEDVGRALIRRKKSNT